MVAEKVQNGEWAIVLGASSGFGLATAKKLAMHGYNLCLIYRVRRSDLAVIETTYNEIKKANGIELIHHNADAIKETNRDDILTQLEKILPKDKSVKVLVHSIAKGNLKPMQSTEGPTLKNDDFRLTIESMAISLYDWTKAIFDKQLFSSDARIISFTSEGNTKAWSNYAAVSTAKVALEAITRNIAAEFAPYGIKANCIQAGVTDTASLRMIPGSEEIKSHSILRNPNGRLTTPEDVAAVTYLLTREESKWITGAIIPVDGGEHLR